MRDSVCCNIWNTSQYPIYHADVSSISFVCDVVREPDLSLDWEAPCGTVFLANLPSTGRHMFI